MKPIEETHPSLKGKGGCNRCFAGERWCKCEIPVFVYIIPDIQAHTLDKEVVRVAIEKRIEIEKSVNMPTIGFHMLKKELGLK